MSKFSRCLIAAAFVVGMSLVSFGEILVYDGFPTGDGAYSTTDGSKLKDQSVTSSSVIGFKDVKWQSDTGVIYSYASGLSLPEGFDALPSASLVGAGSVGTKADGSNDERGMWKTLSDATVEAIKSASELHYRVLLAADSKALGTLTAAGSENYVPNQSALIAGFCLSTQLAYGSARNSNGNTARAISFAIRRVGDVYKLSLLTMDAGDGLSKDYIRTYDLATYSTGKTYICYAKIAVGTGTDGKEKIEAWAQDVTKYDPTQEFQATTEAQLIDATGTGAPNAFDFACGSYGAKKGYFLVDEVALATAANDIVILGKAGAPVFEETTIAPSDGGYNVSGALTSASADEVGVKVIDPQDVETTFAGEGIAVEGEESVPFVRSFQTTDLTADATYKVSAYASNGVDIVLAEVGTIYTGVLTLEKVRDADEYKIVPGEVTVSRANADPYPLAVNYIFSSATEGATAGKTWVAPEPVVIPAGETSATIMLTPILDPSIVEDITVTLSLTAGNYLAGASSVELTLKNLVAPAGYNTWVATAAGKASVAENWSEGRVPISTDKILFDGDFSNADCEWDGDTVGGPSSTVAALEMREGYTGTITLMTTFPEASGSSFHVLTVTGDVTMEGGSINHAAHDSTHKCDYYRLRMDVGGDLKISSGASLSAYCKGSFGKRADGGDASYGGSYNGSRAWGSLEQPYGVGASSSSSDGKNPVGYPAWAGGAIWVEVAGKTVLDGKIAAEGIHVKTQWDGFSGSGGAVYLKTKSLEGTGTISGSADAGKASSNDKSGAGGRVAVVLTESELTAFPVANITAYSSVPSYENVGGAGTVYVKSPEKPNGVLYLRDRSNKYALYNYRPKVSQVTDIPKNQTWKLDGIVFGANSILRVPSDTTLELVNGLGSITSTTGSSLRDSGLYVDGGNLVLPAGNQTISGTWTFQARGTTIDRNVIVDNGGAIGSLGFYVNSSSALQRCDLTVAGDLTVNSGASISASYGGYIAASANVPGGTAISCHGGQNSQNAGNCAYDSFFNPDEAGAYGNDVGRYNVGGGVVKLVVGGTMTLNGSATAKPGCDSSRPGAAGTINITAARLEGTGSINADGNSREYYDSSMAGKYNTYGASGGGRVAVRLTGAGAEFTSEWISKITARGVASNVGDKQANSSSAGSVYLQSAAQGEKCGTIIIRNDNKTANDAWTALPGKDGVDAIADFKKASLSLLDCGKVRLYDTVQMSKLTLAADCKIDLNGKTLTVSSAKLGENVLAAGTYAAGATALGDFVTDSATGGQLIVKASSKAGLQIILR